MLGVAQSGYYDWQKQPLSTRALEDARVLKVIRASFVASHRIYAPRVFLDLREAGETCSKDRIARLTREHQVRALHGFRIRWMAVGKPSVLIPNLLKYQSTVTAQRSLGHGHHLHWHVAGLVVSRGGDGDVPPLLSSVSV